MTALEANKQTKEIISTKNHVMFEIIENLIKETILIGEFWISTNDFVPDFVLDHFEELGYKVEVKFEPEYQVSIFWTCKSLKL